MTSPKPTYVLISPVRNEAPHIERTIRSVVAQSLLPQAWVIIDDGSTDGSWEIIQKYANSIGWIRPVRRPERPTRELGGNIVTMVEDALEAVRGLSWEYWGKLDGDVELGPDYFAELIRRFEEDPLLGIASGKMIVAAPGARGRLEWSADVQPKGTARLYRRACWEQIAPLTKRRLWDVIDAYKARMHGWKTASFWDLRFVSFRDTDAAQPRWLARRLDLGYCLYGAGYAPLFALARCVRTMWDERPLVLGGVAMLGGYILGALRREVFVDPDVKQFVRQEQRQRLRVSELISYLRRRRQG